MPTLAVYSDGLMTTVLPARIGQDGLPDGDQQRPVPRRDRRDHAEGPAVQFVAGFRPRRRLRPAGQARCHPCPGLATEQLKARAGHLIRGPTPPAVCLVRASPRPPSLGVGMDHLGHLEHRCLALGIGARLPSQVEPPAGGGYNLPPPARRCCAVPGRSSRRWRIARLRSCAASACGKPLTTLSKVFHRGSSRLMRGGACRRISPLASGRW